MRRGTPTALVAYVLWGLSPVFWRLGEGSAASVLTFRILATLIVVWALRGIRRLRSHRSAAPAPMTTWMAMATSAVLLGSNWLLYLWAVGNARVTEASLGYFLNPLVSVVLGVMVLRERLRVLQWLSIAVVGGGVIVLSVEVGAIPWISIGLAVSFGLYGLIRKTAAVGSLEGLSMEVAVLAPVASVALVVLTGRGGGAAAVSAPWGWVWVVGTGVMTAVPLLLFADAARRIDLWLVGVLQYVTPTLLFLLGVVVYGEPWRGGQVFGYAVIWLGLGAFGVEGVTAAHRARAVDRPAGADA